MTARLDWLRSHVRNSWAAALPLTVAVAAIEWEEAVIAVRKCLDPAQQAAGVVELSRRQLQLGSVEQARTSLLEDIALGRWPVEPTPRPRVRRELRRKLHTGPFWRCLGCQHWCDRRRGCCRCGAGAP